MDEAGPKAFFQSGSGEGLTGKKRFKYIKSVNSLAACAG